MRQAVIVIGAIFLIALGWFLIWSQLMASDVARVKASIDHHYKAIKAMQPHVTLKADDVYATGFPFGFRVAVERLTLSQVFGTESEQISSAPQTFMISIPRLELESVEARQGRYRVTAPSSFDAMFASEGKAPEKYSVTLNAVPGMVLRAQGDSRACPNFPGAKPCAAVAEDAPLVSFAVQLPASLVLDVGLNGQTKQIGFTFMPVNIPIFQTIPADASRPLTLFVGMLREAMVFQGK